MKEQFLKEIKANKKIVNKTNKLFLLVMNMFRYFIVASYQYPFPKPSTCFQKQEIDIYTNQNKNLVNEKDRWLTEEEITAIGDLYDKIYKESTYSEYWYNHLEWLVIERKKPLWIDSVLVLFLNFITGSQGVFNKVVFPEIVLNNLDYVLSIAEWINKLLPSPMLKEILKHKDAFLFFDYNFSIYNKSDFTAWQPLEIDTNATLSFSDNVYSIDISIEDIANNLDLCKIVFDQKTILYKKGDIHSIKEELQKYLDEKEKDFNENKKWANIRIWFAKAFWMNPDYNDQKIVNLSFNKKEVIKDFKEKGYKNYLLLLTAKMINNTDEEIYEKFINDFNSIN